MLFLLDDPVAPKLAAAVKAQKDAFLVIRLKHPGFAAQMQVSWRRLIILVVEVYAGACQLIPVDCRNSEDDTLLDKLVGCRLRWRKEHGTAVCGLSRLCRTK